MELPNRPFYINQQAKGAGISCSFLLYNENPTLGVGFKKANGYGYERKTPFAKIKMRSANCIKKQKEVIGMPSDKNSLAHTKWNCKYHIVFAPKYRRKVFFGEKKREMGQILRKLCEWKGVNIIEAEICPDHVHMLVEIPPKIAVSSFMGYLKGKSSLMIYEQFGELKFKYRNREFWCRGYYVDTVGKDKAKIAEYIKHQLDEDRMGEQMTMLGKDDPFTGSK